VAGPHPLFLDGSPSSAQAQGQAGWQRPEVASWVRLLFHLSWGKPVSNAVGRTR